MDCSLPGSSVHGIFQAGVLEWGAIAFSKVIGMKYIYLETHFAECGPSLRLEQHQGMGLSVFIAIGNFIG